MVEGSFSSGDCESAKSSMGNCPGVQRGIGKLVGTSSKFKSNPF